VNELVAVEAVGGLWFVDRLRRVWDAGNAVFPLDPRLPPVARGRVLAAVAASRLFGADGSVTRLTGSRPVETGDALVVSTSGSTGEPRGVVLTHGAVVASAEATSARLAVDPTTDRWLACLPLAHVGGLSVVTRALHTGTPLTVLPGFDAAAVAAAGCSLVSLVAATLPRIDAARFRVIVLGGSRPPAERPPNAIATYGMTETGSGVVYDGRPLAGVEVRIDAAGEIQLRGLMLLRAYRDGTDPKDSAGWFPTGDLGHWRDDGRLHVAGRRADLIITGGENVWPEVVEAAIRDHAAIADVAVAGRADPEWGEQVVAFVVPADAGEPPTLATLRDHVKKTLPAWCAPRRLVLVDHLPRTALGKVRRADLP
jgi:o-succinylbenzoate---CoA ligase